MSREKGSRQASPSSGGRLLAIMAHPDDAELWAGGTIAIHARHRAAMIAVSSSSSRRLNEAKRGAGILGATIDVRRKWSIREYVRLIAAFRPDVIVTHRLDDCHPDHRATAEAVLGAVPTAVIKFGFPTRLYSCDSYESLSTNGPIPGRVIVDTTDTFSIKLKALRHHKSQPLEHFEAMALRLGALWGGRIGTKWAEAFDAIPLLGRVPHSLAL